MFSMFVNLFYVENIFVKFNKKGEKKHDHRVFFSDSIRECRRTFGEDIFRIKVG